jgi:N-acetylglucosamine-6-phosphate deacetylase
MKTAIKNARIVTPYEILENCEVIIENGKIADIRENGSLPAGGFDEVIDAEGNYLTPGFIDIHNHGSFGKDVMDATFQALDTISRFHVKNGVTGFLAATLTASIEEIKGAVKNAADYIKTQNNGVEFPHKKAGAELLGIYLEGPYFSKSRKGSQPQEHIRDPRIDELEGIIRASGNNVKVVALAPEIPGALETVSYLKSRGIKVSAGHTDANYNETKKGIDRGITLATHIFNGMRNFTHREPGVVGAVLTDERVYCEMICDGIHLHPATMKLIVTAKGFDRVVLISDAMMACGLSDGEYKLGPQKVFVRNGEARLHDGTLAGSTLTLNKAVYNMVYRLGFPVHHAVRMATLNPARAIGVSHRKGSIEIGKEADLVIFAEDFRVLTVFVKGIKQQLRKDC